MTLLESLKALPVEYLRANAETKEIYDYLKNILEKGKESTPRKKEGVDSDK